MNVSHYFASNVQQFHDWQDQHIITLVEYDEHYEARPRKIYRHETGSAFYVYDKAKTGTGYAGSTNTLTDDDIRHKLQKEYHAYQSATLCDLQVPEHSFAMQSKQASDEATQLETVISLATAQGMELYDALRIDDLPKGQLQKLRVAALCEATKAAFVLNDYDRSRKNNLFVDDPWKDKFTFTHIDLEYVDHYSFSSLLNKWFEEFLPRLVGGSYVAGLDRSVLHDYLVEAHILLAEKPHEAARAAADRLRCGMDVVKSTSHLAGVSL